MLDVLQQENNLMAQKLLVVLTQAEVNLGEVDKEKGLELYSYAC